MGKGGPRWATMDNNGPQWTITCDNNMSWYIIVDLTKVVVCVIHIFTTNILTSRKGITNIKKGITNIRGRVTSDATDISGKHWQQWCTKTNIGEELQTLWSSGETLGSGENLVSKI